MNYWSWGCRHLLLTLMAGAPHPALPTLSGMQGLSPAGTSCNDWQVCYCYCQCYWQVCYCQCYCYCQIFQFRFDCSFHCLPQPSILAEFPYLVIKMLLPQEMTSAGSADHAAVFTSQPPNQPIRALVLITS